MEVAIWVLAQRLGVPTTQGLLREHLPFDVHRRMSVGVLAEGIVCKGAPEEVLDRCTLRPPRVDSALQDMLRRGLRVLAVAEGPPLEHPDGSPHVLALLGLLGFHDPPREGVAAAIRDCRRAGIRLGMITGDHPLTARAVATQIGLALPGSPVLVASDLPDDPQVLAALLDRDGVVLARATPEDKLRVALALQS